MEKTAFLIIVIVACALLGSLSEFFTADGAPLNGKVSAVVGSPELTKAGQKAGVVLKKDMAVAKGDTIFTGLSRTSNAISAISR